MRSFVPGDRRLNSDDPSGASRARRGRPGGGSEAAYVLSGNIERLEEVDQGRDVRAVCTISAQLLDTRTRSIVWSQTASETVHVEKHDMRGVVSSFSSA